MEKKISDQKRILTAQVQDYRSQHSLRFAQVSKEPRSDGSLKGTVLYQCYKSVKSMHKKLNEEDLPEIKEGEGDFPFNFSKENIFGLSMQGFCIHQLVRGREQQAVLRESLKQDLDKITSEKDFVETVQSYLDKLATSARDVFNTLCQKGGEFLWGKGDYSFFKKAQPITDWKSDMIKAKENALKAFDEKAKEIFDGLVSSYMLVAIITNLGQTWKAYTIIQKCEKSVQDRLGIHNDIVKRTEKSLLKIMEKFMQYFKDFSKHSDRKKFLEQVLDLDEKLRDMRECIETYSKSVNLDISRLDEDKKTCKSNAFSALSSLLGTATLLFGMGRQLNVVTRVLGGAAALAAGTNGVANCLALKKLGEQSEQLKQYLGKMKKMDEVCAELKRIFLVPIQSPILE